MVGRAIQYVDGNVDQILSTLEGVIMRFHIETVEGVKNGLEMIPEGGWANDLGSLFLYLVDLWGSARRSYFGSMPRRQPPVGRSNISNAIATK